MLITVPRMTLEKQSFTERTEKNCIEVFGKMFKPEKHLKNERNYDYEFLMITFAVAWSLGALIRSAQYLKQRKQAD